MLGLKILAILLLFLPLVWYIWRERGANSPEQVWPDLEDPLGLEFRDQPPTLSGSWKGREVAIVAEQDHAVARAHYTSSAWIRVEIGPRSEVERAAGMVVPDRVELPGDEEFSRLFLVRAMPAELGPRIVDPALRQRLVNIPGIHVLASGGNVDATVPVVADEEHARDLLDVTVAVADAAEQS